MHHFTILERVYCKKTRVTDNPRNAWVRPTVLTLFYFFFVVTIGRFGNLIGYSVIIKFSGASPHSPFLKLSETMGWLDSYYILPRGNRSRCQLRRAHAAVSLDVDVKYNDAFANKTLPPQSFFFLFAEFVQPPAEQNTQEKNYTFFCESILFYSVQLATCASNEATCPKSLGVPLCISH